MSEKSADIQTLAPRLSYIEDQAKWLMDNRGSGGEPGADPSEKLKKLWDGVLGGAYTSPTSTSWNAESIYEVESISLFQGLYGFNLQDAVDCIDGVGFYGHVFVPGNTTWNVIAATDFRPLTADLFAGAEYVDP